MANDLVLPWDLTNAYVNALASWQLCGSPWSSVRVMLGPVRSFGQSTTGPVCIVAHAGWSGGERGVGISNVTDVDYRYAVAILVPDDDQVDALACEKLRQDLVYAFDQFHQTPANRDMLPSQVRGGRIMSCQFDLDRFFSDGEEMYRIATFEVVWSVRRR